MLGAIIGDIIGSRFEGRYDIPEDFELITEHSHFTDDTVHTLAVAHALHQHLIDQKPLEAAAVETLQTFGRRYVWCGCGDGFYKWLFKTNPEPYNSYGNGAAMRVSACAWYAKSYQQALAYSNAVTGVTHNHPEGMRGAAAVTTAIWLARHGKSKQTIRERIAEDFLYQFPVPEKNGKFQIACQVAVPLALAVFFETNSFEECIRKAVLLGGDTDTMAAIAGSIAEAFYGIPDDLKKAAEEKLDDFLLEKLKEAEGVLHV